MADCKFVSPATYKYKKQDVDFGESMTEQGQTKSLAELVKSAQLGIPLFEDRLKQMQYDPDDADFDKDNDFNDPTLDPSVDKLDLINIQRALQDRIDAQNRRRKREYDDKQRREAEEFKAYKAEKARLAAAKASQVPDATTPPSQAGGDRIV